MIFLFVILILTPCIAQESCGKCNYPYVNSALSTESVPFKLDSFAEGVLTITGRFKSDCGATHFLLAKNSTETLLFLRYYNKWLYFYNDYLDYSSQVIGYIYWYMENMKSFKLQFVVAKKDIQIYVNQDEKTVSKETKESIITSFKQLDQIELFKTNCALFYHVSFCPVPTIDKLCDSKLQMKSVEAGSSITLRCSIRTIFTDPPKYSLKWEFEDKQGHHIKMLHQRSSIATAFSENLHASTLTIKSVEVNDIGSYTCTLYNKIDNSPKDSKVFHVNNEPKINFTVSTSYGVVSYNTSQPVTFNLTKDTLLNWNVTRWASLENLTLHINLDSSEDNSFEIDPELSGKGRVTGQSQEWKYFNLSLADHQHIISLTAVFKMSNKTFRQLLYVPRKTDKDAAKPVKYAIPNNMIFIMIGSVSMIAIVINNIFCWKKNRRVEREETLVTVNREDTEGITDTGFAGIQGEVVQEDNEGELHEAIAEGEEDDGLYAAHDEVNNEYTVRIEAAEEACVYANAGKTRCYPKPEASNACSNQLEIVCETTEAREAVIGDDGEGYEPDLYAIFNKDVEDVEDVEDESEAYATFDAIGAPVHDENEYSTLQRG